MEKMPANERRDVLEDRAVANAGSRRESRNVGKETWHSVWVRKCREKLPNLWTFATEERIEQQLVRSYHAVFNQHEMSDSSVSSVEEWSNNM